MGQQQGVAKAAPVARSTAVLNSSPAKLNINPDQDETDWISPSPDKGSPAISRSSPPPLQAIDSQAMEIDRLNSFIETSNAKHASELNSLRDKDCIEINRLQSSIELLNSNHALELSSIRSVNKTDWAVLQKRNAAEVDQLLAMLNQSNVDHLTEIDRLNVEWEGKLAALNEKHMSEFLQASPPKEDVLNTAKLHPPAAAVAAATLSSMSPTDRSGNDGARGGLTAIDRDGVRDTDDCTVL